MANLTGVTVSGLAGLSYAYIYCNGRVGMVSYDYLYCNGRLGM